MSAAAEATEMRVVRMTINGREVEARAGQTVLEAARAAGVDIPTLCHDPRLEPYGACRLCLVEVEGARGPMASCGTKVGEGMKVETHTEKIIKLRKFVLELLLTNHPLDCPVCEAAGDCRLQDYAYEYLVDMVPWGWRAPEASDPGNHPNIAHFGARCILCGRCVRICREVMSIGCWGYLNRGYESEVDTPYSRPLVEVGCVSCGQCVSTCPVGAVTTQRAPMGARQWQTDKTRTTCSYCSNGCELMVHTYQGRVVRVVSDLQSGTNKGNLCAKGRFGQGYADHPERVLTPLVRDSEGELREASWEEAIGHVSREIRRLQAEGAEQAFALVCGTHTTNEAAYLAQKLVRAVVGSDNLACSDQSHTAVADRVLARALGPSLPASGRGDLEKAEAILVVGSNLTESDPVLALSVIKAARRGKTVIVVDPRRTELARRAGIHLAPKPGTDAELLRGMVAHVLAQGDEIAGRLSLSAEGIAALKESLATADVDALAAAAGIDPTDLRRAAKAFADAGSTAVIFGSGAAVQPDAPVVVGALVDLALLTGAVGPGGGGIYPLRGGANSRGVADMGMVCGYLPGGAPIDDETAVKAFERAWGGDLSSLSRGLDLEQVQAGVDAGSVRLLYVVGCDLTLSVPDGRKTAQSSAPLPFLVVQDCFLTDTAKAASVVLPAAVPLEDDGTYTNAERIVQRVRPARSPKGASLPDRQIFQKLAVSLGAAWEYADAADVMDEIATLVPSYAGLSHDRLDREGLAVATARGEDMSATPGRDTVHRAGFVPLPASPLQMRDGDGLRLITGSVLYHHEDGTRTRRSTGLTKLCPAATVEINASDAAQAAIADGDRVRVSVTPDAFIELPASITDRVPQGVVFIPGFDPDAPVARLQVRPAGTPVFVSVQPA